MIPETQKTISPPWQTRITTLFGIRYPILAGGLMWLADAPYVSAVVRAGAMAFITPRSFESLRAFGQELDRCLELSDGHPFGVNLTLSRRDEANEELPGQLETALAAGVRHFETVGPSPGALIERIHAAGGVVVHKSSTIEHALKAQAQGADALALVGPEAGGHPGMNELPASLLCAYALEELHRPLAWGGGIGTGRQVASALALGCDAVLIGSRLLVCDEVTAHSHYKDRLVDSRASDSVMTLRSTGHPWRVLANATAREVQRLEATGLSTYPDFGDLARGRTGRDQAYRNGDPDQGLLSLGPAVGFANRREPIASVLAAIMEQARDSLSQVAALHPSLRQDS
jgi:nitronate monooxygenase